MKRRKAPRVARPLNALLSASLSTSDGAGSLLAAAEQLGRLERDVHALLPAPLTASVRVSPPRDGALVFLVANNALAARLRQQTPSLIEGLAKRGWLIRTIRIRVSITAPEPPKPPKEARLPRQGLVSLRDLRDLLEPSPLRDALARLVARHSYGGTRKP
ncbi:DciA family protein [Pandoraea sp. PE-S2R-1]|uniref:DciA family protein n=1 Tax=Pandoraea sp. PE-S2R-1 TaxID=1986994 RepID=UPI000B40320B|nr:DciA family protein [Pandoraea sp. PE-S2R-1]